MSKTTNRANFNKLFKDKKPPKLLNRSLCSPLKRADKHQALSHQTQKVLLSKCLGRGLSWYFAQRDFSGSQEIPGKFPPHASVVHGYPDTRARPRRLFFSLSTLESFRPYVLIFTENVGPT